MKNTIDAQVEFSFRGETYRPSITLDLDVLVDDPNTFQGLHRVIATGNNIDTYSYLYDAMESYPISFSHPQGDAVGYLHDNVFDFSKYQQDKETSKILEQLAKIAKRTMAVSDIETQPELKTALLEAYTLGISSKTG